jgi:hypothetical protein
LATVLIEALLAYRVWAQMSGAIPGAVPGSWAYGLAGTLVDPFRSFDASPPLQQPPFVDLAALIAMEGYLAAGLAAAVIAFALSHVGLLARIRTWRLDLEPWRRALATVTFALATASIAVLSAAAYVGLAVVAILRGVIAAALAYLRERDWARYRAIASERWTEVSTAAVERARGIAARPEWSTSRARAIEFKALAAESLQRAPATALAYRQRIAGVRDWRQDGQRAIEMRDLAAERSRVLVHRLDVSCRHSAEGMRRLAERTSPRARRLLLDTGAALYVRGPQSLGWLSRRAGENAKRHGIAVARRFSTRPSAAYHDGQTVSRRDFLRLAVHHAEDR